MTPSCVLHAKGPLLTLVVCVTCLIVPCCVANDVMKTHRINVRPRQGHMLPWKFLKRGPRQQYHVAATSEGQPLQKYDNGNQYSTSYGDKQPKQQNDLTTQQRTGNQKVKLATWNQPQQYGGTIGRGNHDRWNQARQQYDSPSYRQKQEKTSSNQPLQQYDDTSYRRDSQGRTHGQHLIQTSGHTYKRQGKIKHSGNEIPLQVKNPQVGLLILS